MNAVQVALGGFISMVVYGMLFAGVYKLFTIATVLTEIRDVLKKRNLEVSAQEPYAAHVARLAAEAPQYTVLGPND